MRRRKAGYIGKTDVFDRAVGTFSRLYADQTEQDFEVFTEAIKSGEIKARSIYDAREEGVGI